MEELSNLQFKTPQISVGIIQSLYTNCSRYIQMPTQQKEKPQPVEHMDDPLYSQNTQYYQEMRSRILHENNELNSYIEEVRQKFAQTKEDEYGWLSDKYRYYLRKFKKYSSEQEKLLGVFENLDNHVLQSAPVQEEIKSIDFIKMVSQETNAKLAVLRSQFEQSEQLKFSNQSKIQSLRTTLNELNSDFFAKKREEAFLSESINNRIEEAKMTQINHTMQQIRIAKRRKEEEMRKSTYTNKVSLDRTSSFAKPSSFRKGYFESGNGKVVTDSFFSQCESINKENAEFLKKVSQTCENFKIRRLQERKRLKNNEVVQLVKVQQFRQKSRKSHRKIRQIEKQLLKNKEIQKQISECDRNRQAVEEKSSQQLLHEILQKGMLSEVMGLMKRNDLVNRNSCNQKSRQTVDVKGRTDQGFYMKDKPVMLR